MRTYLINERVFPGVGQCIKSGVEVIEEIDNLHGPFSRCMLATESIEAHDATEEDGHIVVSFGRHWALVSQLIGNRWREDRIQQSAGIRGKHSKTRWEPGPLQPRLCTASDIVLDSDKKPFKTSVKR